MKFPVELKYTKTHEWIKELESGNVRIGLTDFAQKALGDIVFVNLPEPGDSLVLESSFADVESVKAVSDVFSPLSGTVVLINEDLLDSPQQINESPYDAWLVEAEVTGLGDLISAEEYEKFLDEADKEE